MSACWLCDARPSARRILREALIAGLPFVAALVLMALSPTAEFAAAMHWTLWSKPQGLILAFKTYSTPCDLAAGALLAGGFAWAGQHRFVRLHPAGIALAALALPVYLAMPRDLLSAWGVDIRLPIAVLLMLIGFVDWRFESRAQTWGFVAAVALLAALRVGVVEVAWQHLARIAAEIERSTQAIAPGSKVLVATVDNPAGNYAINEAVQEMPMRVMIERSSFVSMAFTHPGQQVLAARPAVRDLAADFAVLPTVSELLTGRPCDPERAAQYRKVYWAHWPDRFDYLYLLLTDPGAPNPAPDRLRLLHDGERFQLYRIERR
jgi:hypothetical protein